MSSAAAAAAAGDAPDNSYDIEMYPSYSLPNTSKKGIKCGRPRQKAYDMAECIAITRAMIAAKNDPLRGADSKFEDYISRFMAKYSDYKRKEMPTPPLAKWSALCLTRPRRCTSNFPSAAAICWTATYSQRATRMRW